MSVITTYDENISLIKEHLDAARKLLVKCSFDEDMWGFKDMNEEYIKKVRKSLKKVNKSLEIL